MKIITIFAGKLFAFHYDGEENDELTRLLDLWTDTNYLFKFVKENEIDIPKGKSISKLVTEIIESADYIEDRINELEAFLLVDKE